MKLNISNMLITVSLIFSTIACLSFVFNPVPAGLAYKIIALLSFFNMIANFVLLPRYTGALHPDKAFYYYGASFVLALAAYAAYLLPASLYQDRLMHQRGCPRTVAR